MKFAQGFILLMVVGSISLARAHANGLPAELNFTEEGGSGGVSTGGGPSVPTGSNGQPPANGSAPVVISVPCLTDDGKVAGASLGSVCPAILSKCSDLRRDVDKGVKNMLSLKIWGYYNGKDVDLDKSTLDKLEGVDISTPICSVVGHTLQYRAASNDLEIARQSIGKKMECGTRPHARGKPGDGILGFGTDDDRMYITFIGNEGSLWASYMMGVYPWLIRKHANAVLTTLKPDLTNINEIIKGNSAVRADLAMIARQMSAVRDGLSSESKSACANGPGDLVKKCKTGAMSVTDPSNRLCTLVKAELAMNGGAMPNLLIQEIMSRVQTEYDSYFSGMLAHSKPEFNAFFKGCADAKDSNGFLGMKPKKKYSCVASCLFDGKDYNTWGDFNTLESGGSGRKSRRCTMPGVVSLSDGTVHPDTTWLMDATENGVTGVLTGVLTKRSDFGPRAINVGFAGFIEFIIRKKICGQSRPTDESVCDKIGIPDKPEGAK